MQLKIFTIVKYLMYFLIPFIVLLIFVPKFFPVEVNDSMTGLFALTALVMMGIILLYKWQGHQGNSPMFIGGAILVLGAVPFLASTSIQGSIPIIELDARTQGFALIAMAVGIIFIVLGAKQALSASYFWGMKRK